MKKIVYIWTKDADHANFYFSGTETTVDHVDDDVTVADWVYAQFMNISAEYEIIGGDEENNAIVKCTEMDDEGNERVSFLCAIVEEDDDDDCQQVYAVVDNTLDNNNDVIHNDFYDFKSAEEAINKAEDIWAHLTDREMKFREVYVVKCQDADPESFGHLEGDILVTYPNAAIIEEDVEGRKNGFDSKRKIVDAGNSSIFANWRSHSSLTKEDFLDGLKWLCDDPIPDGKLSRELGLSPYGVVRLDRCYGVDGLCAFYKDGSLWGGEMFYRDPENSKEALYADENGKIPEVHKISISCRDRV